MIWKNIINLNNSIKIKTNKKKYFKLKNQFLKEKKAKIESNFEQFNNIGT